MLNKDGGLLLIRGDYFTLVFDCFIRGVVVRRVVEVFDDAPQFGVIIGVYCVPGVNCASSVFFASLVAVTTS